MSLSAYRLFIAMVLVFQARTYEGFVPEARPELMGVAVTCNGQLSFAKGEYTLHQQISDGGLVTVTCDSDLAFAPANPHYLFNGLLWWRLFDGDRLRLRAASGMCISARESQSDLRLYVATSCTPFAIEYWLQG